MKVVVNGKRFCSSQFYSTKKMAKHDAALECLKDFGIYLSLPSPHTSDDEEEG